MLRQTCQNLWNAGKVVVGRNYYKHLHLAKKRSQTALHLKEPDEEQ